MKSVIFLMAFVGCSASSEVSSEVIETYCGTTKEFSEIFKKTEQTLVATGSSLLGKNHSTFIWYNQFTKSYTIVNKDHKSGKICVMDGGENMIFINKGTL
jgi:hypothetical protein